MSQAPAILAITPPLHPSGQNAEGPTSPGTRVAMWRDAGLLQPRLGLSLLLRPAPGPSPALTTTLIAMSEAAAKGGIPCFVALPPNLGPGQGQDLDLATRLRSNVAALKGIHLKSGWTAASVESWLRATTRWGLELGLSCHVGDPPLVEELSQNLNYCSFAPVFPPQTPGQTPGPRAPKRAVGLGALRTFATNCAAPTLALGGVDASRVPECFVHGARGVASIRALFGAMPQLDEYARAVASAMAVGADAHRSPGSSRDAPSP